MPAPSQLSIAMGAVTRLIKEKASYHDEMEQQRAWLDSHTTDDLDEDSDLYFEIQQREQALRESEAVMPKVCDMIANAAKRVEDLLESSEQMRGDASADEVAAAHVVVDDAKRALREPV